MLDIFSGLRLVVKRRNISIDNAIFRCHWFFTSTLLVSFSLIITARQYVGQPIECHSVNKIPDSLLNSYCWVQSTFTVPQACNQHVGFEVPYPCIDNTRGREIKVFAYYQWVGIVLFIQGLLFHLPYYLWKVWENGLIKAITGGLRIAVLCDEERAKKRAIVVDYIHEHLGCHKRYALKYFICETICLFNLLGQLWATNKFFDGQFLRYGIEVIEYSSSSISSQLGGSQSPSSNLSLQQASILNRSSIPETQPAKPISRQTQAFLNQPRTQVDPMTYIFPRMTKCTYYDFGSSGDVQKHDALCLLPLNIINEKIYIALWFWFLILAILTLLVIIYRLFAIVSENVRCKGLLSRCKLSNENDIRVISRHCDVGDWFLFYMVAENLDPLIMREIVHSVAEKIRAHLELKRELGLGPGQSDLSERAAQKLKLNTGDSYRACSFDDETLTAASSRRNSLADDMPLVKKFKKRLYSKRLWSIELGQLMFGGESSNRNRDGQPPLNPEAGYDSSLRSVERTTGALMVSAPPISQMPLNCMGPPRRSSLTRTLSNNSGSDHNSDNHSCVMEMSTISGRTTATLGQRDFSMAPDPVTSTFNRSGAFTSDTNTNYIDHDHLPNSHRPTSLHGRPQLLRQRRINSISNSLAGPKHHQSMSSIRELRPPNLRDESVEDWPTLMNFTHPKEFAHRISNEVDR